MLNALFIPRNSPLHRTSAGVKLALLALFCFALAFVNTLAMGLGAIGVAAVVAALGTFRPRDIWQIIRPIRWFAVILFGFQLFFTTWQVAALLTGRLVLVVLLAGIVTATTRTSAMMDALERILRPLKVLGVDPARVCLLLSLAIRSIPVVAGIAEQISQAQRARGMRLSPRPFAIALVVGVLREADALGEALAARGFDDD